MIGGFLAINNSAAAAALLFHHTHFTPGEENVYFTSDSGAIDAERREIEAGCLNLSEKEAKNVFLAGGGV